jgi:hypothetical protein
VGEELKRGTYNRFNGFKMKYYKWINPLRENSFIQNPRLKPWAGYTSKNIHPLTVRPPERPAAKTVPA